MTLMARMYCCAALAPSGAPPQLAFSWLIIRSLTRNLPGNLLMGNHQRCARKCCQEERRVTGYDYVLRKANHDLGASDGV